MNEFTIQTFGILDFISSTLSQITHNKSIQEVAERVLTTLQKAEVGFTCENHQNWGKKFSTRIIVNVFYNNKQKLDNSSVRKDQVCSFKQRQRKKE